MDLERFGVNIRAGRVVPTPVPVTKNMVAEIALDELCNSVFELCYLRVTPCLKLTPGIHVLNHRSSYMTSPTITINSPVGHLTGEHRPPTGDGW